MHVRREKKQNITITSKSSAVLLMPRTTWFTAFVRCNTKHIYKSKIKSKKKLNCVKEACNQSVEFHNGSGRNEQQTSSNLKWLKTVFKHSNQLSSECSKTNLPSSYSNNSHTLIDQKIADFLCQCYWEIQSNSFWGKPWQILDRFIHNFRISFFETEA